MDVGVEGKVELEKYRSWSFHRKKNHMKKGTNMLNSWGTKSEIRASRNVNKTIRNMKYAAVFDLFVMFSFFFIC